MLLDHRRRHADRDVRETGTAVGIHVALRVPAGGSADERPLPGAIGIHETGRIVRVEAVGARNCRCKPRRVVEQGLALSIWRERLSLLDADGGELEPLVRWNRVMRLAVDQPGQIGKVLTGV